MLTIIKSSIKCKLIYELKSGTELSIDNPLLTQGVLELLAPDGKNIDKIQVSREENKIIFNNIFYSEIPLGSVKIFKTGVIVDVFAETEKGDSIITNILKQCNGKNLIQPKINIEEDIEDKRFETEVKIESSIDINKFVNSKIGFENILKNIGEEIFKNKKEKEKETVSAYPVIYMLTIEKREDDEVKKVIKIIFGYKNAEDKKSNIYFTYSELPYALHINLFEEIFKKAINC